MCFFLQVQQVQRWPCFKASTTWQLLANLGLFTGRNVFLRAFGVGGGLGPGGWERGLGRGGVGWGWGLGGGVGWEEVGWEAAGFCSFWGLGALLGEPLGPNKKKGKVVVQTFLLCSCVFFCAFPAKWF